MIIWYIFLIYYMVSGKIKLLFRDYVCYIFMKNKLISNYIILYKLLWSWLYVSYFMIWIMDNRVNSFKLIKMNSYNNDIMRLIMTFLELNWNECLSRFMFFYFFSEEQKTLWYIFTIMIDFINYINVITLFCYNSKILNRVL